VSGLENVIKLIR